MSKTFLEYRAAIFPENVEFFIYNDRIKFNKNVDFANWTRRVFGTQQNFSLRNLIRKPVFIQEIFDDLSIQCVEMPIDYVLW